MKMTKELKTVILKGFENMLNPIRIYENFSCIAEGNEDTNSSLKWNKRRKESQELVLKAIEGLIEVEGE